VWYIYLTTTFEALRWIFHGHVFVISLLPDTWWNMGGYLQCTFGLVVILG